MNARRENECHNINCTTYPPLDDLLELLEYFVHWREDTRDEPQSFITPQTYEDLTWCILGLVGICKNYLNTNNTYRVLDQRCHASDVVEHHFGNCNHYNPNGCLSDFQSFSAKSTGICENTFQSQSKANTSGDKYYHGEELAAPLQKVNRDYKTENDTFRIFRRSNNR